MSEEEVKSRVEQAIGITIERDRVLFENDAAERTITAKLACYIQELFPDWDVDCEYNRHFDGVKRLKDICNSSGNGEGNAVYPDIIIHRRMTDENLVVIEVKKTTNNSTDDCDLIKLDAFKQELGYKHGLFVRFKAGSGKCGIQNLEWKY